MTLQSISAIQWNNYRHAYGSAADIPELLNRIAGDNYDDSEEASRELFEKICHQDVIEDVAPQVIDPLVDILLMASDQVCRWHPLNGILTLLRSASLYHPLPGFTPYRRRFMGDMPAELRVQGVQRLAAIREVLWQKLKDRTDDLVVLFESEIEEKAKCQLVQLLLLLSPAHLKGAAVNANTLAAQALLENSVDRLGELAALLGDDLPGVFRMERLDYEEFPWYDGSIAGLAAEIIAKGWPQSAAVPFLQERLHEVAGTDNEEEMIFWGWTTPMLIADRILSLVFDRFAGTLERVGELTGYEQEILAFLKEMKVEMPNLGYYGLDQV
jgi:hypothetical protein